MSILCIGSAVVDIAASPIDQNKKWKEKQLTSSIELHAGGDAVNQSLMLSLLGETVYLSVGLGQDDNGFYLKSILNARGVRTNFLREKADQKTGTALVLVDSVGERSIFATSGAYNAYDRFDCPSPDEPDLSGMTALTIASLQNIPVFEKNGLTEYLSEMKSRRIPVFADLASDQAVQDLSRIKDFLPYLSYFLPSVYDALEMTGTSTPEEAAEVFLNLGAENVVIKCGADGAYYQNASCSGSVPAVPVKTVDTTGAGDAMVAMFIHYILNGSTIGEACRCACAGASYTALFSGASSDRITEKDLYHWIEKYTGC